MIIVYHNDSCITKIVSNDGIKVIFDKKKTIQNIVFWENKFKAHKKTLIKIIVKL